MARYRTLDDFDVADKRVLVRVDFNVPMKKGEVTDATRIERALPTIKELSKRGAKVILLSHYGRPDGAPNPEYSLRPVAKKLGALLGGPVEFASDCVGEPARRTAARLIGGDVALFENTRFHAGEEKNDPDFVKALAENGDLYVNDAFSAAHRAHASTEGLARVLPAAAGRAMQRELDYLAAALSNPERPMIAVVGGAKVSSKLDLLLNLIGKADALVVGGGMANTFLFAKGLSVGKSLCEPGLADTAREIMAQAAEKGCELVLPVDAVVAKKFEAGAPSEVVAVDAVRPDDMILDLGPESVDLIAAKIEAAKTLVWNGPLGAFEIAPFDTATVEAARFAARRVKEAGLVAVAGGGDTVAALNHAQAADDFTYVSTAGGAFLEWLEGKTLPGVKALEANEDKGDEQ
ncbi:phosphoglycerate kinase [Amphiplicatus metriothermophilus]|uniref:Phosphoglycerate kinase n=1 Tax=Amphiplicatus metriothermophilus TaxID=1519374 RepID=A0A239PYH4_9PROT|nr:phosphoglycerate kinase [Amphiplicatus metriothermophilus]MBB5518162.1 phosphoglycerate kinase [Amphiplicatus metriothermophilus]SNT75324.1 phosphoglycerate kinase [Amphiplicatus metriothermophilus]